jgi:hypothetical protein
MTCGIFIQRVATVKVRYLKLISIRLLNSKLKFTARNFLNLKWTLLHMVLSRATKNWSSKSYFDTMENAPL